MFSGRRHVSTTRGQRKFSFSDDGPKFDSSAPFMNRYRYALYGLCACQWQHVQVYVSRHGLGRSGQVRSGSSGPRRGASAVRVASGSPGDVRRRGDANGRLEHEQVRTDGGYACFAKVTVVRCQRAAAGSRVWGIGRGSASSFCPRLSALQWTRGGGLSRLRLGLIRSCAAGRQTRKPESRPGQPDSDQPGAVPRGCESRSRIARSDARSAILRRCSGCCPVD